MTERKTYKITFWFFSVLLAVLPFWSAIIEFLTWRSNLSPDFIFWLRISFETILIILFLATVFNPKWERHKLKLNILDYLIFAYLAWEIASIFISGIGLSQAIQGLRYNGLFFGFYLLARFSFFTPVRVFKLQQITVIAGRIVALLAVVETFIFGSGWWQRFGILPYESTFGYGVTHRVVSVPQAMATFEGPNQLGSFLLLPFFLSLYYQPSGEQKKPWYHWFWLAILALGIILTFSRSAIIGLGVGLVIYILTAPKIRLISRIGIIASFAVAVLAVAWFFVGQGGLLKDFLTHGASNADHWFSMTSTFQNLKGHEYLFGQGVGTSGPASFNFLVQVQESWYLQVLSELGIVGLLLWLGIIATTIITYFKKNRGLALALIAVSVATIFLHTWADNVAVAVSFWLLVGVLAPNKDESN